MQRRPDTPFLSIVTPTKNARRFLDRCVTAVSRIRASGLTAEHIFVDGGSDDGTLAILQNLPNVVVHVEPGLDIVESVACGIDRSTGDFVTTLMADDELTSAYIQFAQLVRLSSDSVDLALAPCLLIPDDHGARPKILPTPTNLWNILSGYPGLNSCIFRRSLWDSDEIPHSYPYTNDRLWILRLLGRSRTVIVGTIPIASMQRHAQSRTLATTRNPQIKKELNRLALELTTLNQGHVFEPVLTLWAWRTALSLAKEALASLGNGLSSEINWPRISTLARIPAGLFSVILGRDKIYQSIVSDSDFRIVSTDFQSLTCHEPNF